MYVDGAGMRRLTARAVVTWFLKSLLWIRNGTLHCRSCGMRIFPQLALEFIEAGCSHCGAHKLEIRSTEQRRWWLVALLVLLAAVALAWLAPIGIDYPVFENAAHAWLRGKSRLYDDAALGYFYAPWSILVFAPLAWLPAPIASVGLNLVSIAALIWGVYVFAGKAPWWVLGFAIFGSIATMNLIASTQWDAFILAAVALGYQSIERDHPHGLGLALAVIGTKPTNALLPVVILVMLSIERWRWSAYRALLIPAAALLIAIPIAGWDWLPRYVAFLESNPPNAGYNMAWMLTDGLGRSLMMLTAYVLTAWTVFRLLWHKENRHAVTGAFLLNLLVSPYVTIYHFITTIPLVITAAQKDTLWLAGLWVASILWLIIQPFIPLYPLALAVTAFFTLKGESHHVNPA